MSERNFVGRQLRWIHRDRISDAGAICGASADHTQGPPACPDTTNLTCDSGGNLWITSQAGDAIVRLPAASIDADEQALHGTPRPDVTLAVPSGGRFNVQGVAVAPDGWVWAVDFDLNRLLGYHKFAGRRNVRWTRSLRTRSGPVGVVAFSSHLLVVAAGDDQSVQVIRLNTRHRIGRSWRLTAPSFGHPHGLTVTRDGALWVSCDTPAIVRFPPEWHSKTVPATATLR
jgi:hypothetical protein